MKRTHRSFRNQNILISPTQAIAYTGLDYRSTLGERRGNIKAVIIGKTLLALRVTQPPLAIPASLIYDFFQLRHRRQLSRILSVRHSSRPKVETQALLADGISITFLYC